MKTLALVDCNNFYVSCERVFNPRLIGKPVVVLSNNDGCIISRSQEAKDLGIEMGAPYYEYRHLFKKYDVVVFSSNYALYGDMSHRVMRTLQGLAPGIEIYSIDEAFLDPHAFPPGSRRQRGGDQEAPEYFCYGTKKLMLNSSGRELPGGFRTTFRKIS